MSSIEHKKGNTNPLLQRLAQAKQGKPVTIGPKPFSSKVDQTIRINRAVSSLNQTVTGSKPNIVHQKPNVCKTINKINNSQLSAGFKHKATFKAPVGTNYAPGWKPNSRIIALHCYIHNIISVSVPARHASNLRSKFENMATQSQEDAKKKLEEERKRREAKDLKDKEEQQRKEEQRMRQVEEENRRRDEASKAEAERLDREMEQKRIREEQAFKKREEEEKANQNRERERQEKMETEMKLREEKKREEERLRQEERKRMEQEQRKLEAEEKERREREDVQRRQEEERQRKEREQAEAAAQANNRYDLPPEEEEVKYIETIGTSIAKIFIRRKLEESQQLLCMTTKPWLRMKYLLTLMT